MLVNSIVPKTIKVPNKYYIYKEKMIFASKSAESYTRIIYYKRYDIDVKTYIV